MSRIHRRNRKHGRRRAERGRATTTTFIGRRGVLIFDEISQWTWAEVDFNVVEFRSKNPEYVRSLEQLSRRGR